MGAVKSREQELVDICFSFNLALPAPSFLDFIVDTDKGRKVSLAEALEYWKRHNP